MNAVTESYQSEIRATDAAAAHLEVFLFYQQTAKAEKKGNLDAFFAKLEQLDEGLSDSIIFLEPDSIWQYSRFMDNNHSILKAYLPETAIEGRSHGLTLKKGFLTLSHVHGCFPGWAKGLIYFKNPFFNDQLQVVLDNNIAQNDQSASI